MNIHRFAISLVALCCAAQANADSSTLYRCSDESGVVLYTNQKSSKKNCTVLSVQRPPPRHDNSRPVGTRASSTPTPSDFPRVSSDQQKARDNDRRAIIERELATEQSNLAKAKLGLASSPTQSLRDAITLHERNIEALNKELAKLK